jgi:hypothetical protein
MSYTASFSSDSHICVLWWWESSEGCLEILIDRWLENDESPPCAACLGQGVQCSSPRSNGSISWSSCSPLRWPCSNVPCVYIYIHILNSLYIYNQCVYKYYIHICTHYDKFHLKQWISTMVFRQGTWQKNSWFWKPQEFVDPIFILRCAESTTRLVGGLEHELDFPYNGNLVIIPTDELIFFRGVGQTPTNRNWLDVPTRAYFCISVVSTQLLLVKTRQLWVWNKTKQLWGKTI